MLCFRFKLTLFDLKLAFSWLKFALFLLKAVFKLLKAVLFRFKAVLLYLKVALVRLQVTRFRWYSALFRRYIALFWLKNTLLWWKIVESRFENVSSWLDLSKVGLISLLFIKNLIKMRFRVFFDFLLNLFRIIFHQMLFLNVVPTWAYLLFLLYLIEVGFLLLWLFLLFFQIIILMRFDYVFAWSDFVNNRSKVILFNFVDNWNKVIVWLSFCNGLFWTLISIFILVERRFKGTLWRWNRISEGFVSIISLSRTWEGILKIYLRLNIRFILISQLIVLVLIKILFITDLALGVGRLSKVLFKEIIKPEVVDLVFEEDLVFGHKLEVLNLEFFDDVS